MHAETYSDGVEEITVGGSIVRVDLVSFSPTERDVNNAPKRVFCQRLIFSIESFANSVELMQKALDGLIQSGAIRRNQPKATLEPAHYAASAEPDPSASISPLRSSNVSSNFR